jgi:hypothetical protein
MPCVIGRWPRPYHPATSSKRNHSKRVATGEASITEHIELEARIGECDGVIPVFDVSGKLFTHTTIKLAITLDCCTVSAIQLSDDAILEGISDQFSLWSIGQTRKKGSKEDMPA